MLVPPKEPRIVVLITGAGAGLGLAFSKLLLEKEPNWHLVLTARETSLSRFREQGIQENDHIWLRALDVTRNDQRHQVIEEINGDLNGVDILVNNAGITFRSVLEHVKEKEWLEQMKVNFRGPAELARLALPKMREKRSGRIVTVSSVGGMMAMPTMALYSASKFALEGAFEALWYEVRPWNIKVSMVQPGFIRSDSFLKTLMTDEALQGFHQKKDAYHNHYCAMDGFIEKWMRRSQATPESVARVVYRCLKQKNPPLRIPATPDAHLFGWIRRFLPRSLYHGLLYKMLPKVETWGRLPK